MSLVATNAPDTGNGQSTELSAIEKLNELYEQKYYGRLLPDLSLTRGLVSFQANKARAVYRWYKFKEAFSAGLIENLLIRHNIREGILLDPFAGSGTALFASSALGLTAEGIELLPIGQKIIETKQLIDAGLKQSELRALSKWAFTAPWRIATTKKTIPELRITRDAYPEETALSMGKFLAAIDAESESVRTILSFALLCILENISFTRKDGQYLRWDYRSRRRQGHKIFNKGFIPSFDVAMTAKLKEIVSDLSRGEPQQELFAETNIKRGEIGLHHGSCLDILPQLKSSSFDCIVTSPPYCNRYDYTRTYALELSLLGVDEKKLSEFRQKLLSCTVENRPKDLLAINPRWKTALSIAEQQVILQTVLDYLEQQKERRLLNNNGIPRMVKGYFYEMACVIFECARVLKRNAPLIMVNDNVRYAGASIPVDVILSEIARALGFFVEKILVLPNGKGNSSQQMGAHGREPLRKCVYVWRKN